jgi:phosphoenolpyruvate-protein phosphotransferase
MSEQALSGLGAAAGVGVGRALLLRELGPEENGVGGTDEQERARTALADVAETLARRAAELRELGLGAEAEILEANQLMAEDPSLLDEVHTLAGTRSAAAAVRAATERHAAALAAIPDPLLAARAADVRQLGRRAGRLLAGAPAVLVPSGPTILVAADLGPAEVAELRAAGDNLRGIALAEGAVTSHAAIMARSLGVPMVVALGDHVLAAAEGEWLVLDGERGSVVLAPAESTREAAVQRMHRAEQRRRALAATRNLPPVTVDGFRIALLCNASGADEVAAGLAAGAEGVGLLRTELAFLDASAWPDEDEHLLALSDALALLDDRVATVRTLDFGADKTPPFLAGVEQRGLALMLAHEDALAAQLRAILRAGAATQLRILFPLVESREQLRAARALVAHAAADVDRPVPEVGAMIETPEAVAHVDELVRDADFLSIGTNDLVQYTLGLDRERPLASAAAVADPAVLALVEATVTAASRVGLAVEVCGEAAGEPPLAALFVGLGVRELSVSPARIDEVRAAVRGVSREAAVATARAALHAGSAREALLIAAELVSGEAGGQRREALDGGSGVVA